MRLARWRRLPPKLSSELAYWRRRREHQGDLEDGAEHYAYYFLEHWGLPAEFFAGKRMLDVGCGPRGSLEWATQAAERVGLDPLADEYRKLHRRRHAMDYVAGDAERMPFADGQFDVISSINSLDHVDDLDAALSEIARVAAPGGTLLLLSDLGHEPTPMEPQTFGWEIVERLGADWQLQQRRDFERPSDNMYDNLRGGPPAFDHGDPLPRPGILSARVTRR